MSHLAGRFLADVQGRACHAFLRAEVNGSGGCLAPPGAVQAPDESQLAEHPPQPERLHGQVREES